MKKKEIKGVLDALKTVKLPKFKNKELRNQIIKIHLFLLKCEREYEEAVAALRTAFLVAYEDEQAEVVRLSERLLNETDKEKKADISKEIDSHDGYLKAVRECNKAIREIDQETVDLDLIDGELFIEEYSAQDDFTLSTVEGLYPIFK